MAEKLKGNDNLPSSQGKRSLRSRLVLADTPVLTPTKTRRNSIKLQKGASEMEDTTNQRTTPDVTSDPNLPRTPIRRTTRRTSMLEENQDSVLSPAKTPARRNTRRTSLLDENLPSGTPGKRPKATTIDSQDLENMPRKVGRPRRRPISPTEEIVVEEKEEPHEGSGTDSNATAKKAVVNLKRFEILLNRPENTKTFLLDQVNDVSNDLTNVVEVSNKEETHQSPNTSSKQVQEKISEVINNSKDEVLSELSKKVLDNTLKINDGPPKEVRAIGEEEETQLQRKDDHEQEKHSDEIKTPETQMKPDDLETNNKLQFKEHEVKEGIKQKIEDECSKNTSDNPLQGISLVAFAPSMHHSSNEKSPLRFPKTPANPKKKIVETHEKGKNSQQKQNSSTGKETAEASHKVSEDLSSPQCKKSIDFNGSQDDELITSNLEVDNPVDQANIPNLKSEKGGQKKQMLESTVENVNENKISSSGKKKATTPKKNKMKAAHDIIQIDLDDDNDVEEINVNESVHSHRRDVKKVTSHCEENSDEEVKNDYLNTLKEQTIDLTDEVVDLTNDDVDLTEDTRNRSSKTKKPNSEIVERLVICDDNDEVSDRQEEDREISYMEITPTVIINENVSGQFSLPNETSEKLYDVKEKVEVFQALKTLVDGSSITICNGLEIVKIPQNETNQIQNDGDDVEIILTDSSSASAKSYVEHMELEQEEIGAIIQTLSESCDENIELENNTVTSHPNATDSVTVDVDCEEKSIESGIEAMKKHFDKTGKDDDLNEENKSKMLQNALETSESFKDCVEEDSSGVFQSVESHENVSNNDQTLEEISENLEVDDEGISKIATEDLKHQSDPKDNNADSEKESQLTVATVIPISEASKLDLDECKADNVSSKSAINKSSNEGNSHECDSVVVKESFDKCGHQMSGEPGRKSGALEGLNSENLKKPAESEELPIICKIETLSCNDLDECKADKVSSKSAMNKSSNEGNSHECHSVVVKESCSPQKSGGPRRKSGALEGINSENLKKPVESEELPIICKIETLSCNSENVSIHGFHIRKSDPVNRNVDSPEKKSDIKNKKLVRVIVEDVGGQYTYCEKRSNPILSIKTETKVVVEPLFDKSMSIVEDSVILSEPHQDDSVNISMSLVEGMAEKSPPLIGEMTTASMSFDGDNTDSEGSGIMEVTSKNLEIHQHSNDEKFGDKSLAMEPEQNISTIIETVDADEASNTLTESQKSETMETTAKNLEGEDLCNHGKLPDRSVEVESANTVKDINLDKNSESEGSKNMEITSRNSEDREKLPDRSVEVELPKNISITAEDLVLDGKNSETHESETIELTSKNLEKQESCYDGKLPDKSVEVVLTKNISATAEDLGLDDKESKPKESNNMDITSRNSEGHEACYDEKLPDRSVEVESAENISVIAEGLDLDDKNSESQGSETMEIASKNLEVQDLCNNGKLHDRSIAEDLDLDGKNSESQGSETMEIASKNLEDPDLCNNGKLHDRSIEVVSAKNMSVIAEDLDLDGKNSESQGSETMEITSKNLEDQDLCNNGKLHDRSIEVVSAKNMSVTEDHDPDDKNPQSKESENKETTSKNLNCHEPRNDGKLDVESAKNISITVEDLDLDDEKPKSEENENMEITSKDSRDLERCNDRKLADRSVEVESVKNISVTAGNPDLDDKNLESDGSENMEITSKNLECHEPCNDGKLSGRNVEVESSKNISVTADDLDPANYEKISDQNYGLRSVQEICLKTESDAHELTGKNLNTISLQDKIENSENENSQDQAEILMGSQHDAAESQSTDHDTRDETKDADQTMTSYSQNVTAELDSDFFSAEDRENIEKIEEEVRKQMLKNLIESGPTKDLETSQIKEDFGLPAESQPPAEISLKDSYLEIENNENCVSERKGDGQQDELCEDKDPSIHPKMNQSLLDQSSRKNGSEEKPEDIMEIPDCSDNCLTGQTAKTPQEDEDILVIPDHSDDCLTGQTAKTPQEDEIAELGDVHSDAKSLNSTDVDETHQIEDLGSEDTDASSCNDEGEEGEFDSFIVSDSDEEELVIIDENTAQNGARSEICDEGKDHLESSSDEEFEHLIVEPSETSNDASNGNPTSNENGQQVFDNKLAVSKSMETPSSTRSVEQNTIAGKEEVIVHVQRKSEENGSSQCILKSSREDVETSNDGCLTGKKINEEKKENHSKNRGTTKSTTELPEPSSENSEVPAEYKLIESQNFEEENGKLKKALANSENFKDKKDKEMEEKSKINQINCRADMSEEDSCAEELLKINGKQESEYSSSEHSSQSLQRGNSINSDKGQPTSSEGPPKAFSNKINKANEKKLNAGKEEKIMSEKSLKDNCSNHSQVSMDNKQLNCEKSVSLGPDAPKPKRKRPKDDFLEGTKKMKLENDQNANVIPVHTSTTEHTNSTKVKKSKGKGTAKHETLKDVIVESEADEKLQKPHKKNTHKNKIKSYETEGFPNKNNDSKADEENIATGSHVKEIAKKTSKKKLKSKSEIVYDIDEYPITVVYKANENIKSDEMVDSRSHAEHAAAKANKKKLETKSNITYDIDEYPIKVVDSNNEKNKLSETEDSGISDGKNSTHCKTAPRDKEAVRNVNKKKIMTKSDIAFATDEYPITLVDTNDFKCENKENQGKIALKKSKSSNKTGKTQESKKKSSLREKIKKRNTCENGFIENSFVATASPKSNEYKKTAKLGKKNSIKKRKLDSNEIVNVPLHFTATKESTTAVKDSLKVPKVVASSGAFIEEPVTPKRKKRLYGFIETHKSPVPVGFRIHNLNKSNSDSDEDLTREDSEWTAAGEFNVFKLPKPKIIKQLQSTLNTDLGEPNVVVKRRPAGDIEVYIDRAAKVRKVEIL